MSEEVLACRVCLGTEVKLFSMHKYQLATAYEVVTGSKVSTSDGLPNYTCSYCSTLLLKYAAFRKQCSDSQGLLQEALTQNEQVTTAYLKNIDRKPHNLTLSYNIIVNIPFGVKKNGEISLSKVNKKPQKIQMRKKSAKICDLDNINGKIENNDLDNPTEDLHSRFIDDTNEDVAFEQDISVTEDIEIINFIKEEGIDGSNASAEVKEEVTFEDSDQERALSEIYEESDNEIAGDETNDPNAKVYIEDDVEVIKLSREQQINEILARKESPNYIHSLYKCDVCYKGFITEITFKNHMERHDPRSGDHVCEVCGSRWLNARALREHEKSLHLMRYRCKRCNHVSSSKFKADEHSRWHQGVKYVCNICGKTSSKSTSHLSHMRIRHGGAAQCRLCGERFLGEYGLKIHMGKAHRFEEKQSTLHCTICKTTFRTSEAFSTHSSGGETRNCADQRWCVLCGSGFDSYDGLVVHSEQHREEFPCGMCPKQFLSALAVDQHRARVHRGMRRCAKFASTQTRVCEVCGHVCSSKFRLMVHLRQHTGEKPHKCSLCTKRFTVVQQLQIHMRTHTGESPYKCQYCPKAFKHKAALNRHHRVHTGDKPYQCLHCDKAFSQSNSLKGHVRTVHLKIPAPPRNRKKTQ